MVVGVHLVWWYVSTSLGKDLALSRKGVAEKKSENISLLGTELHLMLLLGTCSGVCLGTDEDLRVLFNSGK